MVFKMLLVAMPFVPSSFLLLVVRPGAPSSVLAPSSGALALFMRQLDLEGTYVFLIFPYLSSFRLFLASLNFFPML